MSLVLPVPSRLRSRSYDEQDEHGMGSWRSPKSPPARIHQPPPAPERSSSWGGSYSWAALPSPLLSHCCRFLSPSSLITLRLVSRALSSVSLLPSSWQSSSLSWQSWLAIVQPTVAETLKSHSSSFALDTRNSHALQQFHLLPYYLPLLSSYSLSASPPALFRSSLTFLPYLRALRFLDLSCNPELDPSHLSSLTHLHLLALSLHGCERIDDNSARHIAKMRYLQAIDLRGTLITQDGLYRIMLSTTLLRAAEAEASLPQLPSQVLAGGSGVDGLRDTGSGPSPRLLYVSASPHRFGFFSPLASLSNLLSLHLQLSYCQQPLSSSASLASSRSLLYDSLCLHALSQLSPRLRLLHLEGLNSWMHAMTRSSSMPSTEDWLLFFSSFTHLTSLSLSDLAPHSELFNEAFCRRLFPYLAASLEQLELHWAMDQAGLGEDGADEKLLLHLPISTFYLLPFLSALSLCNVDPSPASPLHWHPLSSDLSSLTALSLTSPTPLIPQACQAIQSCARLCFATVTWTREHVCEALPLTTWPYDRFVEQRQALRERWRQAMQWDRAVYN